MIEGIIVAVLSVGAVVAFLIYRRVLRKAKNIERGLKMVPLLIQLPPASEDTQKGYRDVRDVMREKVSQAESLYNLIAGTANAGFKSNFYGQRHIAFEIIAHGGTVRFYAAVPVALVPVIKNAIVTAYPGAQAQETEEPNFFNAIGKLAATTGGELVLKREAVYPIATIERLEQDPIAAIMNALSTLSPEDGAGIQLLIRPAGPGWVNLATRFVKRKRRKGSTSGLYFTGRDLAKAVVAAPDPEKVKEDFKFTPAQEEVFTAIENKAKKPCYETLVRVVASSNNAAQAQAILQKIAASFALYDAPELNGFKFLPAHDVAGLVTAFIFRFFPPELKSTVLNSAELAGVLHLPDYQFSATSDVERQASKQVDGPVSLSKEGLMLGANLFRGEKKDIKLSPDDRRRHTYVVGQTGTGKSTLLENLAVQDMMAGNGFAFIDPHGDTAERLISMVPKERAEDVIYFNPADTDYPLGLNIFEFSDPAQKDFLIQEAINMLYKLYDPGHTGIIGPRYEHWFRNAALTLMSDPEGATFIEIPKVFTDAAYLKQKFKYVTDPTVIDFWTKEMGQTSDYHKSEMLGWFVSKFGAFMSNEIMRNIIGQTKSAFNLREVMDQKKILIVNLSKGQIGELNSQLLGMIFVIKFQAAAMSRASVAEAERNDFCLYVDEFQNFSTDSFATILSEARKYRLNLIVANQYIGQLSDQIRDAVFGNVGTIISYRCSPEDADVLVKQFAPVFDALDITKLPNYQAVVRLMIGGLPSQPFSMQALPPLGSANPELGLAVKQLSAAKHGLSKEAVAANILSRFNAGASTASSVPAVQAQPAPTPVPVATPPASPPPPAAPEPIPASPPVVKAPEPEPTEPVPVPGAPQPTHVRPAAVPAPVAPVAAETAAPVQTPQPEVRPQPITEQPVPARIEPAPDKPDVPDEVMPVPEFKPAPRPRLDAPTPVVQLAEPANAALSPDSAPEVKVPATVPAQPREKPEEKTPVTVPPGEIYVDENGNVIKG